MFKCKIIRFSSVYDVDSCHCCVVHVFYAITTLICWCLFGSTLSLWLHSLCCDEDGSSYASYARSYVFMVYDVLIYMFPDCFCGNIVCWAHKYVSPLPLHVEVICLLLKVVRVSHMFHSAFIWHT